MPPDRRQHLNYVDVLTARRAIRSALPFSFVFAFFIAASAWGYATTYPTVAARVRLARTFGANIGINAILGPARQIDTVAGFTEWRSLGVLSIVGGAWGVLTGTRLLRGEEDVGRWELLLGGATTRRRATASALGGLMAGLLVLWMLPALVTGLVGRSSKVDFSVGASMWLVLAVVCSAAMFLAISAITSQLAATRRQAAACAAAVLGVSYALRMIADSGARLEWLRWWTPLGWVEQLRPMSGPRPLVLIPIVALIGCALGASVRLAGSRDLDRSLLGDRVRRAPRTRLLAGPTGLATRLAAPSGIGWVGGIALGGLLLGMIAKTAGTAIASSASFHDTLTRLGTRGVGAEAYLGVAFLIIALVVALVAAGHIANTRAEEGEGRLEELLAWPVSRTRWLLGRVGVATATIAISGLAAGGAAWAGAATQHSGVPFGRSLEAGVNVLAPALAILGAGVVTFAVRPRLAAPVAYGLLVWSLLVEIVGSVVRADHWLLDTSLFHHMAAAPAVTPNWTGDLTMVALAAACVAVGVVVFDRRDLVGD